MSETKWTPGPWHAHEQPAVILDDRGFMLAALDGNIESEPTVEANAHLIAAAPDLYLGLEAVWKLIEDGTLVRDISKDQEPGWAMNQLDLVVNLKATYTALARARGEQP